MRLLVTIFLAAANATVKTGKKELLFDASKARETYPSARPLEEQGEHESQRLWKGVTDALKKRDHNTATEEKTRIEDAQREEAKAMGGEDHFKARLFRSTAGGSGLGDNEEGLDWILNGAM